MRIALLADLNETVTPDSLTDEAVLAFEIAASMADSARRVGGFTIDLVARRGSWRDLPLISIELNDLPSLPDKRLDMFARQEAAYCGLILAGLLQEYELVHCLAPVVTPLQLLSSLGIPIVQTVLVAEDHPAFRLPPHLLRKGLFCRTFLNAPDSGKDGGRVVVPSVDLERFYPSEKDHAEHVLWLGAGGAKAKKCATAIATHLGLPLRRVDEGDVTELLQNAAVFLYLSEAKMPANIVWPMRAVACGKPVAGWQGVGLEELLDQSGIGSLAPVGEWELLANKIQVLPPFSSAGYLRRQTVIARYNRRAMTARYREVYSSLLESRRTRE